ncbi:hypothetical protein G9464_17495 [Halostella sp. JP-L12]|uniref:cupredoxin domain-containing protein n=1 Tax=Halostella TaxID=1843185 RepID=UPI000EF795C6|nr:MULTISPECIES: plastocyanin/azurin family copper-binding protein [Halostella]NHN49368.1 hypothetical protein [Halostella sp. JP-L12]
MEHTRRRVLKLGAIGTVGALAGCSQANTAAPAQNETETTTQVDEDGEDNEQESGLRVTVEQEAGETFYWVLPGERRLSPHVFGTPDAPRHGNDLLESRIEQAKGLPEPLGNAVPQLLQDLPVLVAAPEQAREPIDDEIAREKFVEPTLYSDRAEVTDGEFSVTYHDNQPYDRRGPPGETADTVDLDTRFTDPAGNEYELDFDHVVQPPIPGYETGGGVITNAWHHGKTGTGSPLMPQVYTYGACWGVGNVLVDGEVVDENKVMHIMTTQTVRDQQYRIALDEEMPLAPENTIAGQVHHTHGVVLPITAGPDGPVFEPVQTAFELPNGETQPFIHAMWEQETLVEAPFADWEPQTDEAADDSGDGAADEGADFRLAGEAGGWIGQAPGSIEGSTNPTLELEAGSEYTLVWENADGIQHNFAIEDANGEDLLSSEFVQQEGATQTVTFTASEEMAEYYCQVHPNSMRGTIELA